MIHSMSHVVLYVLNHDDAKEFYTSKLGFEVRTDATMGTFRWLTVGPADQPDVEISLMEISPGGPLQEAHIPLLKQLVQEGGMGAGVFRTLDCRATYEELKAKGVHFLQEPAERPYGIEATFRDNSGNWFSLTQPLS